MLCRNCFLKHVIEGRKDGKIEGKGRRERRRMQFDLKEIESGSTGSLFLENSLRIKVSVVRQTT
jgi:hypothetical protein